MENLNLYNSLKEVPSEYLKTIKGGRLKGMSDIKPQWRLQKLTEVLGPCGIGWKIQNLKFEYKNVGEEIVCNCYLEFLFKYNGEWSEPIPAIGGNKLATMESNGLYISDEAEKMAYTDAISVASKMIGLASDIYMGHGGKYDKQPEQPKQQSNPPAKELPFLNKGTDNWNKVIKYINDKQLNSLNDVKKHFKMSKEVAEELVTIFEKTI